MGAPDSVSGNGDSLTRSLKLAAPLVGAGLILEMITLYWHHPLAFFVFLGLGGLLVGAGITVYLFALVTSR